MDDALLKPVDYFKIELKDKHKEITENYFDDLVKKSGVDVEANKSTMAERKKKLLELEKINKVLSKFKGIRGLFIFLLIAGVVLAILGGVTAKNGIVGIILLIAGIFLAIGSLLSILLWLNKIIKNNKEIVAKLEEAIKKLEDKGYEQLSALNRLFDFGIPQTLLNKAVPIIEMDKNFSVEKFQFLHDRFGLEENLDENASTIYAQSGSILGNPFVLTNEHIMNMGTRTYTGEITIHWTTTVVTKDGTRVVHHTQVLTAEVTKPCPYYHYETYLIYGNEAAPDLNFSRAPSGLSGKTDKEYAKIVRKTEKALEKKAEKALTDNNPKTNYTKLGNDEFETLFGGTDRDHEVQFRLLFTPLAQQNEVKLIKSTEPYGDDFHFIKRKKLNYIKTNHSQGFDYSGDPKRFIGFDLEFMKDYFIKFNMNYFQGLFFDFVPLLNIPLYQQTKALTYIYDKEYVSNFTQFEHESLANKLGVNTFKHPQTNTEVILKTKFDHKDADCDNVKVTAHSFRTEKRVEYVSKIGGDGRMHTIPVEWIEYIPVSKESSIEVANLNASRIDYQNIVTNATFTGAMAEMLGGNAYTFDRGFLVGFIAGTVIKNSGLTKLNAFKNSNIKNSVGNLNSSSVNNSSSVKNNSGNTSK